MDLAAGAIAMDTQPLILVVVGSSLSAEAADRPTAYRLADRITGRLNGSAGRCLVCSDLWYLNATAHLLRDAGIADLNEKIAMVPANTAGKVVYYATILHAQKLKVAAMLDSDAAGDSAAGARPGARQSGRRRRPLRPPRGLGAETAGVVPPNS